MNIRICNFIAKHFILFIVISNCIVLNIVKAQEWYAQISPNNKDYIEVTINLIDVKKQLVYENVVFEVNFYDSHNQLLKKQNFQFTDDDSFLESGSIYQRNFSYHFPSVQRAQGEILHYDYRPKGTKADDGREGFNTVGEIISNSKKINIEEPEKFIILGDIPKVEISSDKDYRVRNHWKKDQYIHIEHGIILSGLIKMKWWSARWKMEKVQGTSFYHIKNRWKNDQYIHIENGKLECTPIEVDWLSAQWTLESVIGTSLFRLRNRWKNNQYIHIEHGKLESGIISLEWLSAQWLLEPVD